METSMTYLVRIGIKGIQGFEFENWDPKNFGLPYILDSTKVSLWPELWVSAGYKRHQRHHLENDRRHRCAECSDTFNDEGNLRLHVASHATDSLICPECGMKFRRCASFKAHLQGRTFNRNTTSSPSFPLNRLLDFKRMKSIFTHFFLLRTYGWRWSELPWMRPIFRQRS